MSLKTIVIAIAFAQAPIVSFADNAADNSKRNAPIEEKNQLNAQDQGNSPMDIELTQKIRKSVVDKDSLSMGAKNIKIITIDGRVTLKGPVESAQEKREIETIARKFAGAGKVNSQIEVAQKY